MEQHPKADPKLLKPPKPRGIFSHKFSEEFRNQFLIDCSTLEFKILCNKYSKTTPKIPTITLRSWKDKEWINKWLEERNLRICEVKSRGTGIMKERYDDIFRKNFLRDAIGLKKDSEYLSQKYGFAIITIYKWRKEDRFQKWHRELIKKGVMTESTPHDWINDNK